MQRVCFAARGTEEETFACTDPAKKIANDFRNVDERGAYPTEQQVIAGANTSRFGARHAETLVQSQCQQTLLCVIQLLWLSDG